MRKAIALVAAIVATTTGANELTEACAGNAPSATEYRNNPKDYADDFCALWLHERHKALRQLNKALKTNRVINDPNRWYFDSKLYPNAEPIQLRRSWMEGREVKFIDFGRSGSYYSRRICENDGEDPNCIEISIVQSYWPLTVIFSHPRRADADLSSDSPLIEDDGKNGYQKLVVRSEFPNASEAKVCVEAILDRMEHRHYRHPSIESACGGIFKCKWFLLWWRGEEDKIWYCNLDGGDFNDDQTSNSCL